MTYMDVLFQTNIWKEYDYDRLIQSIADIGGHCHSVNVIPFSDELSTDVNFHVDYVFGSNRFVELCRKAGLPTFKSFPPQIDQYDNHLINRGMKTLRWGDRFSHMDYPIFAKPVREKFFTGRVIESRDDFDKLQLATSFIEDEDVELITLSDVAYISAEVRFFVINNTIITASYYKEDGVACHHKIDYMHNAWYDCEKILAECGYIDTAFVMDLGLVGREWKIVELNNINSAGIYKCDTDAIASALKHMIK